MRVYSAEHRKFPGKSGSLLGFLVPPVTDFKNGLRRKLNAILLEFKEENCGTGKLSISAAALTKTMGHGREEFIGVEVQQAITWPEEQTEKVLSTREGVLVL